MPTCFKVACIQNCAGIDGSRNIDEATELILDAHRQEAQLICLPEYFAYLDSDDERMLANAFTEDAHPAIPTMTRLARELGAWILMGSLAIKISREKVHNRSYLIDSGGNIVACYDKIHLFDVRLKKTETYRESATVQPGDKAIVAPTPWGTLGLSICYDLRFAHLYKALAHAGADFLAVPAAFTKTTGEAHWHVLLRTRAIETGCYVFAPCQCGTHDTGRRTYGHSLVVDPWGTILADGGERPGVVVAEVEPDKVREARRRIPALEHDRDFSLPENAEDMSSVARA